MSVQRILPILSAHSGSAAGENIVSTPEAFYRLSIRAANVLEIVEGIEMLAFFPVSRQMEFWDGELD
jgi:hypothetical protein